MTRVTTRHNGSQRVTTGHKPSKNLHTQGLSGSQSTTGIADFDGRSGTRALRLGSQRITNLTKPYVCRISVGHKAPQESQILMAGVAQESHILMAGVAHEPCDPGHNGAQQVINLAKSYVCRISVGHKTPQESHI